MEKLITTLSDSNKTSSVLILYPSNILPLLIMKTVFETKNVRNNKCVLLFLIYF